MSTLFVEKLYIKRTHGEPAEGAGCVKLIEGRGVEGDIYAQGGDRQVCIISAETQRAVRENISREPCLARFSCNIVIGGGFVPQRGEEYVVGGAGLCIAQVGRECHKICKLYADGGECPLVRGAVFARVTQTGEVKTKDAVIK